MIATSCSIGGHTSRRKCGDMESNSEIFNATQAQKAKEVVFPQNIPPKKLLKAALFIFGNTFQATIDMVTRQTDKNECRARDSNSRDKLIRNSHLMAAQAYKGHEWS